MNESKHTPGQWIVTTRSGSAGGSTRAAVVTLTVEGKADTVHEVRERVSDCLNGCDGLNPAAYRDVLAALREALDYIGDSNGMCDLCGGGLPGEDGLDYMESCICFPVRSAIARATGGARDSGNLCPECDA